MQSSAGTVTQSVGSRPIVQPQPPRGRTMPPLSLAVSGRRIGRRYFVGDTFKLMATGTLDQPVRNSATSVSGCPSQKQRLCSPNHKMQKHGRAVSIRLENDWASYFLAKMVTEKAQANCKQRAPIAEFPNARLKSTLDWEEGRIEGIEGVAAEAIWARPPGSGSSTRKAFQNTPREPWKRFFEKTASISRYRPKPPHRKSDCPRNSRPFP